MTAPGGTGVPALTNLSDQSTLPVHVIDIRRDKRGSNVYTTGINSPVKFFTLGNNKLLKEKSPEPTIMISKPPLFEIICFLIGTYVQY